MQDGANDPMDPLPSDSAQDMVPGRPGSGIACRNTYEGTVLTLWGDIDALLRENASAAMATLAARPDPDPVIVDARDVTFIDSSGVAFILQVFVLGEETGSPVLLREPSAVVRSTASTVAPTPWAPPPIDTGPGSLSRESATTGHLWNDPNGVMVPRS